MPTGLSKAPTTASPPSQRSWTAALVHKSGVPLTPAAVAHALPSLDAAYRYQRWLYENAGNTYKFENDLSAVGDQQQLIYLCTQACISSLGTRTNIQRTKGRSQRQQIITADEFLTRAGA